MRGIYFLFPTLFTIFASFLVVRAAAIALMMTGMEKNRARFQALSAFSGTGFTTKEAESVVNHPVRRKIITWLMIFGNAGIVAVMITATSSFVTSRGYNLPINAILLIIGIFVIYKIATRRGFTRRWERFIEEKLIKSPAFEEDGTEDLLHILEGYGLVRAIIKENSSLVGTSIAEGQLGEKGTLVLGIEQGRSWTPVPKASEIIQAGDRLVVYGPLDVLKSMFREEARNES